MTSVLVAHHGRYAVLCINGTRVARFYTDEQANEAARLARGSLAAGLGVPYGLLPTPAAWLGAPRLDDEPRDAA
jgi:hypothetical protein